LSEDREDASKQIDRTWPVIRFEPELRWLGLSEQFRAFCKVDFRLDYAATFIGAGVLKQACYGHFRSRDECGRRLL
jgi:hypothetical protein